MYSRPLIGFLLSLLPFQMLPQLSAQEYWVYFGTYTNGKSTSEGIYLSKFDSHTGALGEPILAAAAPNPSFLAVHPTQALLFAALEEEDYNATGAGALSAFSIDPQTGTLSALNTQSSEGKHPCHVSVDDSGAYLLAANYTSGTVASFQIKADGTISPALSIQQHSGSSVHPDRQQGPHAHSIYPGPISNSVYVADLGIDQIVHYIMTADGDLQSVGSTQLQAGSGPRHMAFHPNGRFAFLMSELTNTISAFSIDSDSGALSELQSVSSLPVDAAVKNSTAEIQVHPSGAFLYGSNRGHDSIVIYAIDPQTGHLTYVENTMLAGKMPRNFRIDPSGRYLLVAGQRSNTVEVFEIDLQTGRLIATDQQIEVPTPTCVGFFKS